MLVLEEGNKAKFRNVVCFSLKETIHRDYFMCHAIFISVSFQDKIHFSKFVVVTCDTYFEYYP